ncbi:chemotaxis protein CheB [Rubrobacter marinus]|uniref:chemotaxis protein CheB n=1 Tax=Rubrobacter marinus TaxID=2653852 RepID=UPI001A9FF266|nr:chemotaxis protein CheB [Rubrobacter marinus]
MDARFGVVALTASLGGLAALTRVLSALPADFPVPVVVVRHLSPKSPGMSAELLGRRTPLEVRTAEQGDVLRPGAVHLAPPNGHLIVAPGGALSLSTAPSVNYARPSADVLFRSVARTYGSRALAAVLTGSGADGAEGAREIKEAGGTVIAQDRATSEAFGMPGAAISTGCTDFVLPLDVVPAALVSLTMVGWASRLLVPPPSIRAA